MRNTERSKRFPLTKENEIATFEGELKYYREHNTYAVRLFNKDIITNLYNQINVQVVVTKACNYHCPFCIEREGGDTLASRNLFNNLDSTLAYYNDYGIKPFISLTGGEPTLLPDSLVRIWRAITRWNYADRTNINTNGADFSVLKEMPGIRINLSRHHYCETKAKQIFHTDDDLSYILAQKGMCMQCVLMKDYIGTVPEVKRYIEFFASLGAQGFSFRGMSSLDTTKRYSTQGAWTNDQQIDFFALVNEVANDPDFRFVQQKIGDHYVYEIYEYKGKVVRFTYSNFDFLRKVEVEERNKRQWYSRATIIGPSGNVYAGWAYDINLIY